MSETTEKAAPRKRIVISMPEPRAFDDPAAINGDASLRATPFHTLECARRLFAETRETSQVLSERLHKELGSAETILQMASDLVCLSNSAKKLADLLAGIALDAAMREVIEGLGGLQEEGGTDGPA